jgi:hypothetical protein
MWYKGGRGVEGGTMATRTTHGRWRVLGAAVLASLAMVGTTVGWCEEAAIAVGEKAPAFTLAGSDGHNHSLAGLIGHKRLVLIFYRGVW